MHDAAIRTTALDLIAAGVNDCEIARRLGIPRTTVRDWRRLRYVARSPQTAETCWRCWKPTRPVRLDPADYTELLGLYLGDGHICSSPRTERLRIFLDARHTTIVSETEALLRRCFPHNRVGRVCPSGMRMVVVNVYNGHLSCILPQHGPRKKHERPIVLEPWQEALVAVAPWPFLRGLVRSDGCVYVNRTGPYEYLSYCFDNLSADIRALFMDVCRSVGVECRTSRNTVRIYRRRSVARMYGHVGVKC